MPPNGTPGYLVSSQSGPIRRWLEAFYNSNQSIYFNTFWLGVKTKSWAPFWYHVDRESSMKEDAWKELIYYMYVIEKTYQYYDVIKPRPPGIKSPPVLDLPSSITDENRVANEVYMRRIFLSFLAHSLVLEKNNVLGWSLSSYGRKMKELQNPFNKNPIELPILSITRSDFFYRYRFPGEQRDDSNSYRYKHPLLIDRARRDRLIFDVSPFVSPSNPVELFLWMKYIGILDISSRSKTRDNLIKWWMNHEIHNASSHFSDNVKWSPNSGRLPPKKPNGSPYTKEDHFYSGLFGTCALPPLIKYFTGHCADREAYPMLTSPNIKTLNKKEVFQYRHYFCWGGTEALSYMFTLLNIPAYSSRSSILINHSILCLPAEPDPTNPEFWLLSHTDDLVSEYLREPNPLYPPPMSEVFWTWDKFRKGMLARAKGDIKTPPVVPKFVPILPLAPWDDYRIIPRRIGDPYLARMKELSSQHLLMLANKYPNLPTIMKAIQLSNLLPFPIFPGNEKVIIGKKTGWKYSPSDIYYLYRPSDPSFKHVLERLYSKLQESSIDWLAIDDIYKETIFANRDNEIAWNIANRPLGKLLPLLLRAYPKTGSINARVNAEYYFDLYDQMLYSKYTPPKIKFIPEKVKQSFSELIPDLLEQYFNIECV